MATLLTGYLGSGGIIGISSPLLATGISNGFIQYALSGIVVNTTDVGSAGSGTGMGTGLNLPTPVLIGTLTAAFEGAQIRGSMRQLMIIAIANTISDTIRLAFVNTVNVGVGTGTGKVTLVPSPILSIPLMIANFISVGLVGVSSSSLASAIAQGIDLALPSVTGAVVIAGSASSSPGTGVGVGKIL